MRSTRAVAAVALIVSVGTFLWVAWHTATGQGNAWDGAAAIIGAVVGGLVSVAVALYVLHSTLANDAAKVAEERRLLGVREAKVSAQRLVPRGWKSSLLSG